MGRNRFYFRGCAASLALAFAVLGMSLSGETNAWIGGTAEGDWSDESKWSLDTVPSQEDDVTVSGAASVVCTVPIAVRSLSVEGGSTLKVSLPRKDIASTAESLYANFMPLDAQETIEIKGGSTLIAGNDLHSGAAVKITAKTFILDSTSVVTSAGLGWFWYQSSDDPFATKTNGSYQSRALGYDGASIGYKYAPFLPGAPNTLYQNNLSYGRRGGGTVWIHASERAEIAGSLNASAKDYGYYGAASGGSIWVLGGNVSILESASLAANAAGGQYIAKDRGGRMSVAAGIGQSAADDLAAGSMPESLKYVDNTPFWQYSANGVATKNNVGTSTLVYDETKTTYCRVFSPIGLDYALPQKGFHTLDANSAVTFRSDAHGATAQAGVYLPIEGYIVSNATGVVMQGDALEFTLTAPAEPFDVVWLSGPSQYLLKASAMEGGRIFVGGIEMAEGFEAITDEPVLVEARPIDGYEFVSWEGDLPFIGSAFERVLAYTPKKPCEITARFRPVQAPVARTWTGTGNWTDAAKWNPQGLPGHGDDLVIASGTCTFGQNLKAASLALTGGNANVTQGSFDGEVEISGDVLVSSKTLNLSKNSGASIDMKVGRDFILAGNATVRISGGAVKEERTFARGTSTLEVGRELRIEGTSVLYPQSHEKTGGSAKITAERFYLAPGAAVNADYLGYGQYYGPGIVSTGMNYAYLYQYGAGHGGKGGKATPPIGQTYGFARSPVMPGSGNCYGYVSRGGGLIRIHAKRAAVYGRMSADGQSSQGHNKASGGAIWLTADRFLFGENTVMRACGGGWSSYGSNGGGGRIALGYGLKPSTIEHLALTGEREDGKFASELGLDGFLLRPSCASVTVDVSGGKANNAASGEDGTFLFVSDRHARLMLILR